MTLQKVAQRKALLSSGKWVLVRRESSVLVGPRLFALTRRAAARYRRCSGFDRPLIGGLPMPKFERTVTQAIVVVGETDNPAQCGGTHHAVTPRPFRPDQEEECETVSEDVSERRIIVRRVS